MIKKGLWIALEGGDGAGKTTVQEQLAVMLTYQGLNVVLTREPGGNDYSEKMRALIFAPEIADDPKSQLFGFVLARRRNIYQTINPALENSQIIIADRSEGSTYAYQVFEYGLTFEEVSTINNYATDNLKPDLTILLDVELKTGLERVQKAKALDANYFDHQKLKSLEKRRAGYLELAKNYQKYNLNPWIIIDANQPLDQVCQDAFNQICQFFNIPVRETHSQSNLTSLTASE